MPKHNFSFHLRVILNEYFLRLLKFKNPIIKNDVFSLLSQIFFVNLFSNNKFHIYLRNE